MRKPIVLRERIEKNGKTEWENIEKFPRLKFGKAKFRIKLYEAMDKYKGYDVKASENRVRFKQGNFKYIVTLEDTDKLPVLPDECLQDLNAVVKHLQNWVRRSNELDLIKETYELYDN